VAQDIIEKTLGKVSQFNPMSVEKGSCIVAENCVFEREGVAENRRGHAYYAEVGAAPATVVKQFLTYLDTTLIHYDSKIAFDNGTSSPTDYGGSYDAPTGSKIRSAESNRNLYFTTSEGIKRISNVTGTAAVKAGLSRPTVTTLALTGASGFLADNTGVAYRACFVRYDTWGNTYTSEPSLRNVINSFTTGGTRNVTVRIYLTGEITTSDLVQVYRTSGTTVAAATDDNAGDECALVYQINPTSTDITNGYIEFTDSIVDALRGASLYTNASQQGAAQENGLPPLCYDTALFKGSMCFAQTATKERLSVALIATASLTGKTLLIKNGTSTITMAFGAAENAATPQAKVFATGIAAYDIAETAKSICKMLNLYSSNSMVNAYYQSGSGDLPGKILLEGENLGDAEFYLEASDTAIAGMFSPQPPTTGPATATTSANDTRLNGLYVSKPNQPEHVPALNYYLVGANNKKIKRIAALRDSLIILKEDGVFRLVGGSPSDFSITPLDNTVILKADNSVVVLGNQVFALTNQGIVSISDSGVVIVSRDIEPDIKNLLSYTDLEDYCFGIAYETDRHYILSTKETSSDTEFNICYVYNYLTQAWSTWTFGISAGIVEPTIGKLFFSKTNLNIVYKERKDNADTDYQDPEFAITITAIGTTSVTFTSSTTPNAGDVIEQSGQSELITSVVANGTGDYTCQISGLIPSLWAAGAAYVYPGVDMTIKYHPWHAGAPHMLKQVRSVSYFPDPVGSRSSASSIVATVESNFDNSTDEITVDGQAGSWGGSAWGSTPWGGGTGQFFPTLIPVNKSYCAFLMVGFKHINARERISVCTVGLNFEVVGDRVGR
jgi:hypothetical protein